VYLLIPDLGYHGALLPCPALALPSTFALIMLRMLWLRLRVHARLHVVQRRYDQHVTRRPCPLLPLPCREMDGTSYNKHKSTSLGGMAIFVKLIWQRDQKLAPKCLYLLSFHATC
jgi:hypothetical protein